MDTFDPVGPHVSAEDISSVVTLSPPAALARNTAKLRIQAVLKNVRYTLDGTDPTSSSGFELAAGDPPITLVVTSGMVVKVIEEAAASDLEYQWGK